MNRTRWTVLLAGWGMVAAVLMLTGILRAQGTPAPTGRVASLDVGSVFTEYQRMKDINEELKNLQTRLEQENKQRAEKVDALKNNVDLMNRDDPALAKKMQEWLEAQIAHKAWFDVQQAHATRELALATDRIYRDILHTTEAVARQAGYDLVLYSDQYPNTPPSVNVEDLQNIMRTRKVLYASQAADITQLVLEKLNSEYRAKPHTPELLVP